MTPPNAPPATAIGTSTAPPTTRSTILLVDDHPLVRRGLSHLINAQPDLLVCGEAAAPDEALAAAASLHPSLAIIDLGLGGADGLDLVKSLAAHHPALPLLVCSMHPESAYAERALRAGARGYVMKQEPDGVVLAAIRRVLAGQVHLSESMASRMVLKLVDPRADAEPTIQRLSEREFEVFRLIGRGLGPSEIARRLGVSIKTIETHREHIKQKLHLPNGRELTRAAILHAESDPGATSGR